MTEAPHPDYRVELEQFSGPMELLLHLLDQEELSVEGIQVARICDRYLASSIAYGEAQGLDPAWLDDVQRFLPRAALTIMLDIAPETAVKRKSVDRDRYERDLALQQRVRESYRRQEAANRWVVLDGEREKDVIAADVFAATAGIVGSR